MTVTLVPVPDLPGWPEYAQAVEKRDRLAADLVQAQNLADRLRREVHDARDTDDRAAAEAIASGKTRPPRKAEQANRAATEDAEAAARALEIALRRLDGQVMDLLRREKDRAAQAADDALEQAREQYEQAIAHLTAARDAFHAAKVATAWVGNPGARRWKRSPAPPLHIPGVVRPNGEPLNIGSVLTALEAEVDGHLNRPTSAVFTPGMDQRTSGVTPPRRIEVPDEINNDGSRHVIYVSPDDELAYVQAKRAREAQTLARDKAENEAAARATAKMLNLPDPLADLRE